jgi:hypothetical protein
VAAVAYVAPVYKEQQRQLFAVYALSGVTAADTFESKTDFKKVTSALWMPATGPSVAAAAAIATNTNITIPAAASLDDGWLILVGSAVF